MAQRNTGRVVGALALLAVFLPLLSLSGCKLLNRSKKAFGEDCAAADDCESLECATYGSVCTKTCVFDKDCGSGYVCRAHDGTPGDSCAKPTGQATGQTCNNPSECQTGNCLKPVGQQDAVGFCSAHCETEAECPDGFKFCHSISDSGSTGFCLPGGAGGANIPNGSTATPPVYVAPRPVSTTTRTTTSTTTTTTTTTTASTVAGGGMVLKPTGTAATTAAPTATASATTATSSSAATTGTAKRPPIILKPIKKK